VASHSPRKQALLPFESHKERFLNEENELPISLDEAIAVIVAELRGAAQPDARVAHDRRPYGCDLWVKFSAQTHLQRPGEELRASDLQPFYDAAWELSRRGVLRPGPACPRGQNNANTAGEGFSLTAFGRDWVERYDQPGPFPLDPGRFAAILSPYADLFGRGFEERASEAAGCYRTLNYLACCSMCGAACESILLALAIGKKGDEEAVLSVYLARDGRRKLIDLIVSNLPGWLSGGIRTASSLLSYWRDASSHGHAAGIGEFQAHDALSRLLRFAQLTHDEWDTITTS
jgi:hypothetical protein